MITFFTPIIAFFGTLMGRVALGGGLVAAYFGWLLIHDHKIRVETRDSTIARIDQGAKELDAKGKKAADAVELDPLSADRRLRKFWCGEPKRGGCLP